MPQESLTGIKTRTVAEEHGVENLAEMAVRDLFSDHADRLDTVDFLMMTSTSPGILLPATASIVGGRLFREKPSLAWISEDPAAVPWSPCLPVPLFFARDRSEIFWS